ncbi:FAD:protein FMN transferase [Algibacter pectinivorans]|uniref:FAD:protein FMN transferase n=1 Tax=Algibacter pectinivorans TaxID=870482 RepID=A0A1I1Q7M0_9FLAO|nr:FAD:protein FMN transferase [Algibacter pectinivorans]SFD15858.1 thiamine biosynthesis lipoprotein [Algibacter pectinivorans]
MNKIIIIILISLITSCNNQNSSDKLKGSVFGTSYLIQYETSNIYKKQLDSLFNVINKSLSTYQIDSDISKLNRNESFVIDKHFMKVYDASKEIFGKTEGAFDPTIGNLVNAWNFGSESILQEVDSLKIDSLMQYVGYDKTYRYENTIRKSNPNVYLEFNAIAKGYAVDVVSEFLESKNIENYLVEIGGEIRAKGINTKKQSAWKVGVEEPNFEGEQVILRAVTLTDEAMATSGTYRKFKIDEAGNRYAHIIDTETGYPSKTNLLSISVIAKSCMIADAYATAFKAMGIDRIKTFLENHPELKVFLIFENDEHKLETLSLNGFPA